MKDIICKCGHGSLIHSHLGCGENDGCMCTEQEADILRAHIAKLEAVAGATRHYIENKKGKWTWQMTLMIEALDALDSPNVPS